MQWSFRVAVHGANKYSVWCEELDYPVYQGLRSHESAVMRAEKTRSPIPDLDTRYSKSAHWGLASKLVEYVWKQRGEAFKGEHAERLKVSGAILASVLRNRFPAEHMPILAVYKFTKKISKVDVHVKNPANRPYRLEVPLEIEMTVPDRRIEFFAGYSDEEKPDYICRTFGIELRAPPYVDALAVQSVDMMAGYHKDKERAVRVDEEPSADGGKPFWREIVDRLPVLRDLLEPMENAKEAA